MPQLIRYKSLNVCNVSLTVDFTDHMRKGLRLSFSVTSTKQSLFPLSFDDRPTKMSLHICAMVVIVNLCFEVRRSTSECFCADCMNCVRLTLEGNRWINVMYFVLYTFTLLLDNNKLSVGLLNGLVGLM